MEDNSPAHNAFYTPRERGKVTIAKINLEILGLPGIMECRRALNGANSYHVVLCTSRAGSIPSSPLESLGDSRVLAGAVAAWAPLLCPERNFTHNMRKYLQV